MASGCRLSPVLSCGAEPTAAPTLCTHATQTLCSFVQYLWSLAGLHPTRTEERAQAQERKRAQITSEFVAIHLSSALCRFCARSVPPTQGPEWAIMGYFGSSHSPFQNYERQTRTRGPHDPAALSMHEADQHPRINKSTERYFRSHHLLKAGTGGILTTTRPKVMNNSTSRMATVAFLQPVRPLGKRANKDLMLPYGPATSRKVYAVAS